MKDAYDDGRVIANMDVEDIVSGNNIKNSRNFNAGKFSGGMKMTKSETRQYTWYSLITALLIGSVFTITWVLFILFCTKIWFR